jgi:hypothetical protein
MPMTYYGRGRAECRRLGAGVGYLDFARACCCALTCSAARCSSSGSHIAKAASIICVSDGRIDEHCDTRRIAAIVDGLRLRYTDRFGMIRRGSRLFLNPCRFIDGESCLIQRDSAITRCSSAVSSSTSIVNLTPDDSTSFRNNRFGWLQLRNLDRCERALARMFTLLPMYLSEVSTCVRTYTPGLSGRASKKAYILLCGIRSALLSLASVFKPFADGLFDEVRNRPILVGANSLKLCHDGGPEARGGSNLFGVFRKLFAWHVRKCSDGKHGLYPFTFITRLTRYTLLGNVSTSQSPLFQCVAGAAVLTEIDMETVAPNVESVTYFIRDASHGRIKIGVTDGSAEKRRRQLSTGSPCGLALLGVVLGNREAELHERFAAVRLAGEWFQDSLELMDFIRENAIPQPEIMELYGIGDLVISGPLCRVCESIERSADGVWTFILKVDGEARLPDGRRIRVSRHVGFPATEQIGRKVTA